MAKVPTSHPAFFAKSTMWENFPHIGDLSQQLSKPGLLAPERELPRLSIVILYPNEGEFRWKP